MEKLMHKRLQYIIYFLEDHKILHQIKFGFRINKSTENALTHISEMVKWLWNFCTLEKGIRYSKLLNKLEHYEK